MNNTLIEVKNVTKAFPGVLALDNVSFDCRRGEVHALCGENGAGKSTLMKILAGVYQPDSGAIYLRGQPVRFRSPHDAQSMGISIIYQELNLLRDLNVAQNVFLGREPRSRFGFIDRRALERAAEDVLHRLGVDLDPRQPLSHLSLAQQQMVEIAKALSLNADLVIMDEPSASLGGADLRRVYAAIEGLKQQNIGVVYISHRLIEVFEIADRITVMKDARVVDTRPAADLTHTELVRMMIGRTLSETFPARATSIGEEVLTIHDLSAGSNLHEVNLTIRKGQIVGLAGLVGSGRSELANAIFGLNPIRSGEIRILGKPVTVRNPSEALKHGIGFVTENRKEEGLVLPLSVRHNAALASLPQRQRGGFVLRGKEKQQVGSMIAELNCRTPHLDQEVQYLSGGNQQKVVLAKWLIRAPKLIILDEPTRGIDVGAKSEIWQLMRRLAERGTAILLISSELPEVIGMSDVIVVMYRGTVASVIDAARTTEEEVMLWATGGKPNE